MMDIIPLFITGIDLSPQGASTLAAINSAVDGLVRWLAIELSPMRVNVVSPGIVNTPIYAGMPEDQRQGMFNGIAETTPC